MSGAAILTVNGQAMTNTGDAPPATVLELLRAMDLNPAMVVAEVNGEIVKRADFAAHPLRDGDAVELVRLVGGG